MSARLERVEKRGAFARIESRRFEIDYARRVAGGTASMILMLDTVGMKLGRRREPNRDGLSAIGRAQQRPLEGEEVRELSAVPHESAERGMPA